jgi:hypothetical protein
MMGSGRFNLEAWLLDRAGLSFAGSSPSALLAAQFFFDALFPFAILIAVSLVTRPPAAEVVDRFFGIMKTPVGATPELDAAALAETRRDPRRFERLKIFPGSGWEFTRWDRTDGRLSGLLRDFGGNPRPVLARPALAAMSIARARVFTTAVGYVS